MADEPTQDDMKKLEEQIKALKNAAKPWMPRLTKLTRRPRRPNQRQRPSPRSWAASSNASSRCQQECLHFQFSITGKQSAASSP